MKILLTAINTKYIHSNLAVYSLRAFAKAYKQNLELAEFTINRQEDEILQELYLRKPDVLCFSCYLWNLSYVQGLAREFHKLCPHVPIWAGGPEVTYDPEAFLEHNPAFTGVMAGEGEMVFKNLCGYYLEGSPVPAEIPGIIYRTKEGKVIKNRPQEALDLSLIPFCYENMEELKNRIIYYESSRGCPFSCSYCLSSLDKKLRFRKLSLVKKELAFFIEKEVPQVKFVDRTFNCDHKHATEIWKFIKEQDRGITNFHFEISADLLTEEEIELISGMRPGLIQLEIGVQSTNERTIQAIHRSMSLSRVKHAAAIIRKQGNIHEHLDLIAGLPFEDYKTFRKSFREIYSLKPNQLQLGFLKVLKGSDMYLHAKEYGLIYKSTPPYEVMQTKWLSYGDILSLKQVEAMVEVYYNSGQFEVTMKLLETQFEDSFLLYERLGAFYRRRKYFDVHHSRIQRCEKLLEFIEEEGIRDRQLFEEALLYDLYYRENLKSRPKFAADMKSFREMTHRYCKNGRLSHVEPFHYRFPGSGQSVQGLPLREKEPYYVLFSYDKRDPLSHQAMAEIIQEQKG